MSTSTFTQLLNSELQLCIVLVQCCFSYILIDLEDCLGQGAQDGHLDFHTAPEL